MTKHNTKINEYQCIDFGKSQLWFMSSEDHINPSSLQFNYELFNCNNVNILLELELPRLLAPDLPSNCLSITFVHCSQSNCKTNSSALWFIVTTSLCQDWVIYAPAAFLGCGSHLSGSLSEIEPKFFVTRYCHGSPIHYHPKLIGQKLERHIAT